MAFEFPRTDRPPLQRPPADPRTRLPAAAHPGAIASTRAFDEIGV